MEPLYKEYLANRGTIVKPYYWLSFSPDCSNCPYHIRTGEEARVPCTEFYQLFGFPYGLTSPQTKHLTFYELKTSSGSLVQKGHASSCTGNSVHPEAMLFEMNGYLESTMRSNGGIRHVVLYSNNTPCNEADHCCISKMYSCLRRYPDITLSIYFSQLYHTEPDCPSSAWNREALRSLASLWPQVTLSPISGGIWHSLLHRFVSGVRGTSVSQPILSGRALADRHNAYAIHSITGVRPYFTEVLPWKKGNSEAQAALESYPIHSVCTGQPIQVKSGQPPHLIPDPRVPVVFVLVPLRDLPPMQVNPNPHRPRNIVRHLNMPPLSSQEPEDPGRPPTGRPVERIETTEQFASSKESDERRKKGKK